MAIPVRLMTCQPGTAGAVANTAFNTEVTKNTEATEKNFGPSAQVSYQPPLGLTLNSSWLGVSPGHPPPVRC